MCFYFNLLQKKLISYAGYRIIGNTPLGSGAEKTIYKAEKEGKEYAVYVVCESTDNNKEIPAKTLFQFLPQYIKNAMTFNEYFAVKKNDNKNLKYLAIPQKQETIKLNSEQRIECFNYIWTDVKGAGNIDGMTPYHYINNAVAKLLGAKCGDKFETFETNLGAPHVLRGILNNLAEKNISINPANLKQFLKSVPSICTVFSTFIADKQTVSKYILGLIPPTTDNLLMKLTVLENLRLLTKHTLKALVALHHSGYVYKDIHPENILAYTYNKKIDESTIRSKIKYVLTDFDNCAIPNDEYGFVDDIKHIGYGLLIPIFLSYCCDQKQYVDTATYSPSNIQLFNHIPKIKKSLHKIDELFPAFLKKLENGTYKTAQVALNDPFVTTPVKFDNK